MRPPRAELGTNRHDWEMRSECVRELPRRSDVLATATASALAFVLPTLLTTLSLGASVASRLRDVYLLFRGGGVFACIAASLAHRRVGAMERARTGRASDQMEEIEKECGLLRQEP